MIKQQFFTVMGFEFMTFMRNKVYIGITIFIVILLALGLSAPRLVDTAKDLGFGGDPAADDPSRTIYVLNQSGYEDLYGALTAGLPEERWSAGEPEQREAYLDRSRKKKHWPCWKSNPTRRWSGRSIASATPDWRQWPARF